MGSFCSPALDDLSCLASDRAGCLYGLTHAEGASAGTIAVWDASQEVLTDAQSYPGGSACEVLKAQFNTLITTTPPILFHAHGAVASDNGHCLAVYGYDDEEERAVVVVVDLQGRKAQQPITVDGRSVRVKQCAVHEVDSQLFTNRPGLAIQQVAWHPHSPGHLVVLASDNVLRLYSLSDLTLAEQSFHLHPGSPAGAGGGGHGYGLSSALGRDNIVGFGFGSQIGPWGPFTVYCAASSGAIYSLCPVAPFGMSVPTSVAQQQAQEVQEQAEERAQGGGDAGGAWLCAAYGVGSVADLCRQSGHRSRCTVLPHIVPNSTPDLVGPLNKGSESMAASAHPTTSICVSHTTASGGSTLEVPLTPGVSTAGMLQVVTVLSCGRADGRVFLHLLAGSSPQPAWLELAPHYVSEGAGGGVTAVRYECSAAAAPSGLSAVLVDCVDIPITPFQGQPSSLSEDDEDDEGSGAGGGSSQGLDRAVRLVASDSAQHFLWAVHASGVWGIHLTWLPAARRAVAQGSASDKGLSQLPAPVVLQMLSAAAPGGLETGAAVVGCALVQDVFSGSSLWALQEGGRLSYMKPKGPSGPAPLDAAATKAITAGGGTAGGVGGAGNTRQEAVEAALSAVYDGLLSAPQPTRLPQPSGADKRGAGAQPAEAEGAAHLSACIRALRAGPVEFAHHAHHALRQRAAQLAAEAGAHEAAAGELSALHASLMARQAALAERLARAQALHTNLGERAALLAQLHWSLPRPLSDAERQLGADLEVAGTRKDALVRSWRALNSRAQSALAAAGREDTGGRGHANMSPMNSSGLVGLGTPGVRRLGGLGMGGSLGVPSPGPGSKTGVVGTGKQGLPAAQLHKVHALVGEQCRQVGACISQVRRLEAGLAAHREHQAEAQVIKEMDG